MLEEGTVSAAARSGVPGQRDFYPGDKLITNLLSAMDDKLRAELAKTDDGVEHYQRLKFVVLLFCVAPFATRSRDN